MQLTIEQVRKVAQLARLEFTEEQLESFSAQLASIISFVEQLKDVDTEGVEVLSHPHALQDALREDEVQEGLSRQAALANAPAHDGECFLVPPVLG
ncbi:MAG: aspartyl/glutamyl-tRNA(Asn/Gln) amidotransferase subunit C [Pirellulaceae bacterium]|nr:MAG: aspartyl/glutamyl-tRNA(Asn/Gln) amidotransferase subunit C [Pirellulaceae bacterium]